MTMTMTMLNRQIQFIGAPFQLGMEDKEKRERVRGINGQGFPFVGAETDHITTGLRGKQSSSHANNVVMFVPRLPPRSTNNGAFGCRR